MAETTRPMEVSLDDALKLDLFEVEPRIKMRAFKMEQPFQVMTRYNTLEGGEPGDYLVVVTDARTGDDYLSVIMGPAFETTYITPESEEKPRKKTPVKRSS